MGVVETKSMSKLPARAVAALESNTMQKADKLVVIHDRFADSLVGSLSISRERISTVRNWAHTMPTTGQSIKSARVHLGWDQTSTIVLHAGNMGAKQGLENVISAAAMAAERKQDIQFILLGDGNQREKLEAMSQAIPTVKFIDPLDDHDFATALAAADYLLVNEAPGISEMAVPSKLTTYFNASKPVIAATDPLGITAAEIRISGAGVVVPSGEPESLLSAICKLHEDPVLSQAYGIAGAKFARERLSAKPTLDTFAKWIDELAVTPMRPHGLFPKIVNQVAHLATRARRRK